MRIAKNQRPLCIVHLLCNFFLLQKSYKVLQAVIPTLQLKSGIINEKTAFDAITVENSVENVDKINFFDLLAVIF